MITSAAASSSDAPEVLPPAVSRELDFSPSPVVPSTEEISGSANAAISAPADSGAFWV